MYDYASYANPFGSQFTQKTASQPNQQRPTQTAASSYASYYQGLSAPQRPHATSPMPGYAMPSMAGAPQSQPFFTGVNPAYTEYIKQFSPEEQRKRKIKELMDAQAMFQSQAPASPYGMTSTYNPPQYLRMG